MDQVCGRDCVIVYQNCQLQTIFLIQSKVIFYFQIAPGGREKAKRPHQGLKQSHKIRCIVLISHPAQSVLQWNLLNFLV